MNSVLKTTSICGCLLFGVCANAQETVTGGEFFESRGVDFDNIELRIETVSPGLHVLSGAGGNVAVSIGDQGVLVVDDKFPTVVPKIEDAISRLGGGNIDFVINTHWHFDHIGGNPLLSRSGSWIVSHDNSRRMMTGSQLVNIVRVVVDQPPSPPEGLAVITYRDRMQFHFTKQEVIRFACLTARTSVCRDNLLRASGNTHADLSPRERPFLVDSGSRSL